VLSCGDEALLDDDCGGLCIGRAPWSSLGDIDIEMNPTLCGDVKVKALGHSLAFILIRINLSLLPLIHHLRTSV
jgi:hypothetical protein